MDISNSTVLITGGAGGIGFALAEEFLKKGAKVKICDKNKETLKRAKELHPEIDIFECDLADKASRFKLFDWATSDGTLNFLLNNAGIQRSYYYTDSNLKPYDAGANEIEIDLASPIHLCELFIPYLLKKPEAYILNVASSLAVVHTIEFPVYCACKAGMHAFTRCIREQLKNTGIKVFGALPPAVESGLNPEGRAVSTPKEMMPAAEYAAYVTAAVEADRYEIFAPFYFETLENKTLKEVYEYFQDASNPR